MLLEDDQTKFITDHLQFLQNIPALESAKFITIIESNMSWVMVRPPPCLEPGAGRAAEKTPIPANVL